MDQDKKIKLFNSYFCPSSTISLLYWVNHSKSLNIDVRLTYFDHTSTIQGLLNKDDSVTIHQKNIQTLATLMYKVKNSIAAVIVSELFSLSSVPYNLRSGSRFQQPCVNTVWNGLKAVSYLGLKI